MFYVHVYKLTIWDIKEMTSANYCYKFDCQILHRPRQWASSEKIKRGAPFGTDVTTGRPLLSDAKEKCTALFNVNLVGSEKKALN